LKRKELRFEAVQESLEEYERKGDRGDRETKLEIANTKIGTYPPPPPNCRRVRKLLKTKERVLGFGGKTCRYWQFSTR
jgi:hypothetical protein